MGTHQAEVEEEEEEEEVEGMAGQAVAAATVATGMNRVVLSAELCLLSPSPLVYRHAVILTAWYICDHHTALFCETHCVHVWTALRPDAVLSISQCQQERRRWIWRW